MKRILLLCLLTLLVSSCSKKEEPVAATSVEQYRPPTSNADIVQTQPIQETMQQEQVTEAMLPAPDMYESTTQSVGNGSNSLGDLNFSNMPTNALVTTESSTEEITTIDTYTSLAEDYTRQNSLLETTTVIETTEQTTEATTEETTVEETEESKVSDLIPVEPTNRTGSATGASSQYSKNADVIYQTRDNPFYRRNIEVPDVLGYGKDAYDNYIINDELFVVGQTKLPKFSKYGYKIPYLYWYDKDQKLLNPMPSTYTRYSTLFYTADDVVIDPYKVEETTAVIEESDTDETTASPVQETTASVEVASIDDLDIKVTAKTEQEFMDHAAFIGTRCQDNRKRTDYDIKLTEDIDYVLDEMEIEYATSIGLGGYYENKIGPGFQEAEGSGTTSKLYTFTDQSTGKVYQLTILQVKQLIGSGKWRELNKDRATERMRKE